MMPGSAIGFLNRALHRRPGNPERHANQSGHDDSRKPDLLDNKLLCPLEAANFKPKRRNHNSDHMAHRNIHWTEAQRSKRRPQ